MPESEEEQAKVLEAWGPGTLSSVMQLLIRVIPSLRLFKTSSATALLVVA